MTLTLRDPAFLGSSTPAAPWTPAQLGAALRVWLDADDASTITLNGSNVSQWRDKSGGARHFSQATASDQYTYAAGAVNGRAAITCTVLNKSMTSVSVPFDGSGMSIFAVGRPDTALTGGLARLITRFNSIWLGTWFTNINGTSQPGAASVVFGTGPTWTLRGTHTVAWEDTLRTVGGTVTAGGSAITYVDGVAASTLTMGWANFTAALTMGHPSGGSQSFIGPICEIVATVDVIGTSDRQNLEGYLAHKWWGAGAANNLAAGHPFKSAPPTV